MKGVFVLKLAQPSTVTYTNTKSEELKKDVDIII